MPSHQGDADKALTFQYTLRFGNTAEKTFSIQLDRRTLQLILPKRASYPAWTALDYRQCPNCPLNKTQSPQCPAAVGLIDIVEDFAQSVSIEEVDVTLRTQARSYTKKVMLPEVVSSLIGVLMATSGCPVLGKLRPMVRHHLPFATLDETQYRVLSMYLLAQYLLARKGAAADWDLQQLPEFYEQIRAVNSAFVKRIQTVTIEDANLNAIVRLDTFADHIAFTVQENMLDDLEQTFHCFFE